MNGPRYAELQCTSHFSFLRGASSCEELFAQAAMLGIEALAVVDRNSLAGIVRAHEGRQDDRCSADRRLSPRAQCDRFGNVHIAESKSMSTGCMKQFCQSSERPYRPQLLDDPTYGRRKQIVSIGFERDQRLTGQKLLRKEQPGSVSGAVAGGVVVGGGKISAGG